MRNAYDLERFVDAQDPIYPQVLEELRSGRKQGHWMWFVFPQLKGLGQSYMADRFGLASLAEADAYLAHRVLGQRLRECTDLVCQIQRKTAEEIFGQIDAMKFRSSMTLFARAAAAGAEPFQRALEQYYRGEADPLTCRLLETGRP